MKIRNAHYCILTINIRRKNISKIEVLGLQNFPIWRGTIGIVKDLSQFRPTYSCLLIQVEPLICSSKYNQIQLRHKPEQTAPMPGPTRAASTCISIHGTCPWMPPCPIASAFCWNFQRNSSSNISFWFCPWKLKLCEPLRHMGWSCQILSALFFYALSASQNQDRNQDKAHNQMLFK